MKHFKLLLASLALMGAVNANAQTDVTSQYITNADMASTDGWTAIVPSSTYYAIGNGLIGTFDNYQGIATVDDNHLATEYCFGFECRWQTNFANYTQTTSELPAGVYTLTFDVENVNGGTSKANYENRFYVQIGENKITDSAKEWMNSKSSWTTHTINFTVDDPAAATISLGYGTGTNNIGSGGTPRLYVSHLKLTYQSMLDGVKAIYEEALAAAQAALENPDYSNVSGSERDDVQNSIGATTGEYTPQTKEEYESATEMLNEVTARFISAKEKYDAFVAAVTAAFECPELPYASPEKLTALEEARQATPANQDDAVEKTASITTAIRAYYESHALAEGVEGAVDMTSKVSDANSNVNTGWTKGIGTNRGQGYTDAAGNVAPTYLDGGWSANAGANIDMTREVAVPAGKYLLTVTARGAVDLDQYTLSIADQTIDLPHIGGSGGVFNNGWNDASVEFVSDGNPLTLEIIATSTASQQWISLNRFRLVRLELYTEMANEDDYAALNDAITAAEAKTLGFDEGEYAPYNNTEALQAIADAKAIDQTVENGKDEVNALTNKLGVWVANTEELNAIYDGTFAQTEANETSGDINLPGWTKVQGLRLLVKDEAKDPGLAYTDGKAAVFSWGGTTLTYGEQTGYTLPLNAGDTYELSFKISGWRDGDFANVLTVNLDGQTQTINPNVPGKIDDAEGNPFANVKFYLRPAADNSILTIYANHHFAIADLKLMKAVIEDVVLEDAAIAAPTAEFGNVTYGRKLVEGYNTLVLPFDVTKDELGDNVEAIYAYGGSTKEGEGENAVVHLDFTQAVENLAANTPYIVKMSADQDGLAFNEKEFKTVAEPIKTDANFDFVGTYVELPAGNDVITSRDYISVKSGLKQATAGKQLKAFRAYLKNKSEEAVGAKVSIMIGGEVVDGIQAAQILNNVDGTIYNLNGQKVSNAQKGIFIQNGKKVVIK